MGLTVGLFIGTTEDSYGHALISGAWEAAHKAGAHLIVFSSGTINSLHGYEAQRNVLYDLVAPQVLDCVVMAGSLTHSVPIGEILGLVDRFSPLPTVSISVPVPGVGSVVTDNEPGMKALMEHVLSLHAPDNIAFFSGPPGQTESETRKRIFLGALKKAGKPMVEVPIYTGDFTYESGREWARKALADGRMQQLRGVVCANDSMALGILDAVTDAGLRVPQDLFLTGFDDTEEGAVAVTPLTSVRQPTPEHLASEAVTLALERAEGGNRTDMLLPSSLIIRQSCGTSPVAAVCRDDFPGGLEDYKPRLTQALVESDPQKRMVDFLALWESYVSNLQSFRDADCILDYLAILLEPLGREHALDLFRAATSIFYSVQHIRESRLRLQAENRMNRMRDIGEALMMCSTLEDVYKIVAEYIPRLDFKWFSLALFEDSLRPELASKLVLQVSPAGERIKEAEGSVFASKTLVPGDPRAWFPHADITVVEAIYSKTERLGFALIGTTLLGTLLCGPLRSSLSSALHNVLLIDTIRKNQTQMIQQEKLAGLGSLVAGVAHEINTPLGVALTASTYSAEQIDKLVHDFTDGTLTKSQLNAALDNVKDGANLITVNLERASELIQSFRQIANDQSNDYLVEIPLKAYMEKTLLSLQPQWKHRSIRVEITGSDDAKVTGYPGSISQIFTNLLMNCLAHAYPTGRAGTIVCDVADEGDRIKWVFTDDGIGIQPSHLAHIFDPFFTTKRGQGGTGLGLHIVYNLVTGTLGGEIACKSKLDEGTSFIIRFPKRSPERFINPAIFE